MNENLQRLREDLKKKVEEELELNSDNFNKDNATLTEKEQSLLEELREQQNNEKSVLMVTDTDADGKSVQVPAEDFAKSLDERVAEIPGVDEGSVQMLKTINSGDIIKSVEQIKSETKDKALQLFRTMSVNQKATEELSDEGYMDINNQAIAAIQKYLGVDKLVADEVTKKLSKLPLRELLKILPQEFLDIYMTPEEQKFANVNAKERLMAVIAYLTTTGPELDYLNDYIDEENKLMIVSKRLMQCQVDFGNMLKDDKKMSELLAQSYAISPADDSFWSKHIRNPKQVHNEFAQRVVIYQEFKKGFETILKDYPECPENIKARETILQEISECDMKIDVYRKICDLTMMSDLWSILEERLKINKKTTMQSLTYEANEAIEKLRRCKQNLPFPGYDGKEKRADRIMSNCIVAMIKMFQGYNNAITAIHDKNESGEDEVGVAPIAIEGYDSTDVWTVYSVLLIIIMGRILKRCTKNNSDKYDAITLDAYFQMFCRMGTDIYVMRDMWMLTQDFVKYCLEHYYLPGKAAEAAKKGSKK